MDEKKTSISSFFWGVIRIPGVTTGAAAENAVLPRLVAFPYYAFFRTRTRTRSPFFVGET